MGRRRDRVDGPGVRADRVDGDERLHVRAGRVAVARRHEHRVLAVVAQDLDVADVRVRGEAVHVERHDHAAHEGRVELPAVEPGQPRDGRGAVRVRELPAGALDERDRVGDVADAEAPLALEVADDRVADEPGVRDGRLVDLERPERLAAVDGQERAGLLVAGRHEQELAVVRVEERHRGDAGHVREERLALEPEVDDDQDGLPIIAAADVAEAEVVLAEVHLVAERVALGRGLDGDLAAALAVLDDGHGRERGDGHAAVQALETGPEELAEETRGNADAVGGNALLGRHLV